MSLTAGVAEGDAAGRDDLAGRRYAAYFHALDAWTEYWDIYHPESRGRFYFGDDEGEAGLLRRFLPRDGAPPPWRAWKRVALDPAAEAGIAFVEAIGTAPVREAIREVDDLLARLFAEHFGRADRPEVQADYLEAVFRFAIDTLPAAPERDARIAKDDPRKSTAGRHTLEGDIMWFAWALHTEAAQTLRARGADPEGGARRALALAGVAMGCAAQFTWRGHRRTRPEYRADTATRRRLRERGLAWAQDFDAAAEEVHALYRIREFGAA
ncbi:hypothetical protein [Phenylobacterium sp.]|jgi:hypothetical protein|uniref:hypothetical protein n=1 Tax=Phenylobacterium sp. TaxID=1871053 RepID=UPI002F412A11